MFWVSYLEGIKQETNALFLSKIYVLDNYRGKKIGKHAMQFVENKAKTYQLKSIRLTVNINNTNAIKAYEKLPEAVLALYPTANHVGREVAKKLIAAKERDAETFNALVQEVANDPQILQIEGDDKRAMAVTKLLTAQEQTVGRKEAVLENDFVSVQRNLKSGDLSIKIDNKVMTDKRLEQLTKLLKAFN